MIEVLRLLNELEQSSPRHSWGYYVKPLSSGPLPQFGHDFPDSPLLLRDWVWIAYSHDTGKPLAILIACPMQGIAMVLRAYAIKEAPQSIMVGLLRKFLADIHSKGYNKFLTCLDLARPKEAKLARIILRSGGRKEGEQTFYSGDVGKCLTL